jgi:hypothetical protein
MIGIHDFETGETIIREMNDEEFAENQIAIAAYATEQAEAEVRASAKASAKAKLSALGLTEEEITALTN